MREMKDSGAKWLGLIPNTWNVHKLKFSLRRNDIRKAGQHTVLSLYREFGVIPKDSRDDNHNVTSEDTSKYKFVQHGDFVINKMKAWQGSVGVSKYEGIVSPAYYVYNFINNDINKDYFHYLIRSNYKHEFRRLSGGIREGQWDLPSDALDNTVIIIPPLEEQHKIADFLDHKCSEIDALTADIQTQIETLEEYKKSVITEAVTKGLDPNVEMKDSGVEWIGKIPANFISSRLKYICKIFGRIGFRGYTIHDFVDAGEGAISLSPSNLKKMKMDFSNCSYISWEKYNESPEIMIKEGDIIFVKTGSSYGKSCFVEYLPCEATLNPQLNVFKNFKILNKFFYYFLQTNIIGDSCKLAVVGGTIPTISQEKIINFSICYPHTLEEQRQITDFLDQKCSEIDQTISEKQQQLETLAEYKKSLIYEYVTGKKEVA